MNAQEVFAEWLQLNMAAKLLKTGGNLDDFRNRLSKTAKFYGRLDIAEQGEVSEILAQYNQQLQEFGI